MPTEVEMKEQFRRGEISLPPLALRLMQNEPVLNGYRRCDALVEVSWNGGAGLFVVEFKARSTPKVFQNAVTMLKSCSLPGGYRPMLVMPYLRESQLKELEREGISGLDLCGNGVVIVPGKLLVSRRGGKNRFPSSAMIKNIYRKNSSMVGRVFLARSRYNSVQDIYAEVNRRNMLVKRWGNKSMSLSTVSKSLKTLEEDLIIERKNFIRLVQPDKLLEKLNDNYEPPVVKKRIRLDVSKARSAIVDTLRQMSLKLELPVVATGISSVDQYAVMQRGELFSVYCTRVEKLAGLLPGSETDRFPNLELLETADERVFFDASGAGDFRRASPVQVYLELMAGDKRDKETAQQVKSIILGDSEREGIRS